MTTPGPAIDMHAHVLVSDVERLVAGEEGRRLEVEAQAGWNSAASNAHNQKLFAEVYGPKFADVDVRLADMDAMGIDIQAISTSPTQYHYWAEEGMASRITGMANEFIARMVGDNPARFVGLGAVALQHPKQAVATLREAVENLGLRGVEISTRVGPLEIADPSLEPFWEAAEGLGAVVFIHPLGCTLGERLAPFYLGNVVGNPVETAVALSHLVFSGVMERYPRLKIVAAHGGGYLPYYFGRSDHGYSVRPEAQATPHPPSYYLKKIWFDSLIYEAVQLQHLVEIVGAGQVVLGTDYPFDMGVSDPLQRLAAAGLGEDAEAAIRGGNAAGLLGIG